MEIIIIKQMVNRIVDVRMFFGVISDCVVEIMRSRDDDCLCFFCGGGVFFWGLMMVGFSLL